MSLGTLTIDLAANVAGLESDLGKAQRVFDKNSRDFQRSAAGIAKVTAGVAAAVAVGFAAMVKSSIDTADELSKSASIVGVSIENLSGLKHAADLSGVGFDQLGAGLNKFNKQVADAAEGVGTGADAFKQLGINVKDSDGALKNNYTLIEEVADALSQYEDGATKSAIAQDLFGKSGAKLIPLLNGGKQGLQEFSEEARRLGLIFNDETGKAAERFNDNLSRLQSGLVGIGNVVAGQVVDDLANFTDALADPKVQEGVAVIATALSKLLGLIGEVTLATVKMYGAFTKDISQIFSGIDTKNLDDVKNSIAEVRGLLSNPGMTVIFDPLAAVKYFGKSKEELQAYLAYMLEVQKKIESNAPAIAKTGTDTSGTKKPSLELIDTSKIDEKIQKLQTEIDNSFRSQVESYRRQIALTGEVTELERVRYEYTFGALAGIDEKQKVILDNQAREIDNAKIATKAAEDRKAIESKLMSDLESARNSLLTQEEALTKAAEEREKVFWDALMAGKIGVTEYGELIKKNGEELNASLDGLKNKTTELSEFTKNLYRGVQDSIADAIVNGIKGGGENALEAFRDLLIRMAAEAAAANLTKWLFGGTQNSGGGSGQGANTVGWINMAASLFGGGLAVGGPAYSGKMYEVGENNRPELFKTNGRNYMIPGNGGSVVPASGGGGNVININMSGVTNAKEGREAAGAIARKVSAAVSAGARYS